MSTGQAPGLMTREEHDLVDSLGQIAVTFQLIAGDTADLTEAIYHIHALQNMVLAQAAARAYPERYRALGAHLGERTTP